MFHFGAQAADGWKKTSEACGTTVSEAMRDGYNSLGRQT